MSKLIFWLGYLYVPFLLACLYLIRTRSGAIRLSALVAMLLATIVAYARFVEPRILRVEHSQIMLEGAQPGDPTFKIALFSDTHFGVFKHAISMQRIVDEINREAPDVVMIAGDFLYYLPPDDIPIALASLADLQAPIFAVLGNHDVGFPGPIYTKELYAALSELGVIMTENRAQVMTLAERQVVIAGASDLWQQQQDFSFSTNLADGPIVLLTHNPDTAFEVPASINYDLMLAGHTHGGQIRIPGLYKKVIPTEYPFDKGLYRLAIDGQTRLVFVSPGTGMVGLPFRFNIPPQIDILTVTGTQ